MRVARRTRLAVWITSRVFMSLVPNKPDQVYAFSHTITLAVRAVLSTPIMQQWVYENVLKPAMEQAKARGEFPGGITEDDEEGDNVHNPNPVPGYRLH